MATIFQNLNKVLLGKQNRVKDPGLVTNKTTNYYTLSSPKQDDVIFRTNNKEEFNSKALEARQQALLSRQWYKASLENAVRSTIEITNVQMMYRDAQIMDTITPEIGAALDIVSEEACMIGSSGKMVMVNSKSNRIKSILEDLLYNRLDLHIMLPMVCRGMCKYGNDFMLLNLVAGSGVMGWMELPVFEMQRIENGLTNPYQAVGSINQNGAIKTNATQFLWTNKMGNMPFKFFNVAHFRLITDSSYLPYGVSWLHKARRSWRMLTLMEDMMLLYRLERTIERRVFKIYTGDIDEQDIPSYVETVANQFKRTQLIDPETGQLDLRKQFLSVDTDFFIPFRKEENSSKIENLQSATNQTSMEDIEYMRGKMLAALRVPKAFLNFNEAAGKGQNLSFLDVRFSRMINRIQQALLMELNKVCIVHLWMLGFTDDLTNFTLTMHNPSSQVQQQELDMMGKKVQTMQQLLADPGNGIQIMSYHRALKEVMGYSDTEIAENLNEIRLEKALAAELENTTQIIKKTGIFDPTDRIYGDPEAKYNFNQEGGEGGPEGGPMGGGPIGGMDIGGEEVDGLGSPGEEGGDISGQEENVDMSAAPAVDAGVPLQENKQQFSFFEAYMRHLGQQKNEGISLGRVPQVKNENDPASSCLLINEELTAMTSELNETIDKLIGDESKLLND